MMPTEKMQVNANIQAHQNIDRKHDKNTIDLFDTIPTHILFDKILSPLNIREILQFGQALSGYNKYTSLFLQWLLSDRTRNLIYSKMTSGPIIDFLVDLQLNDDGSKREDSNRFMFGEFQKIRFPPSIKSMERNLRIKEYEDTLLADNSYEPIDFSLSLLSGLLLDHLFGKTDRNKTPVTNIETFSSGVWIKMPGQNPKNKISWTQKIIAKFLLQAPKKMGLIFVDGQNSEEGHSTKIVLPDFYDEPIKNDPENCHLYEYLLELKLDTIEGRKNASILSAFVMHFLRTNQLIELRIRNFCLKMEVTHWQAIKLDVPMTKIYRPANKSPGLTEKNYLEKIDIILELTRKEISHFEDENQTTKKLIKNLQNRDLRGHIF